MHVGDRPGAQRLSHAAWQMASSCRVGIKVWPKLPCRYLLDILSFRRDFAGQARSREAPAWADEFSSALNVGVPTALVIMAPSRPPKSTSARFTIAGRRHHRRDGVGIAAKRRRRETKPTVRFQMKSLREYISYARLTLTGLSSSLYENKANRLIVDDKMSSIRSHTKRPRGRRALSVEADVAVLHIHFAH